TYGADGRPLTLNYGNGVKTTQGFNSRSLLSALSTVNTRGTALQSLSFTYDTIGNVQAITDAAFGRSQSFSYDELNRLTLATGAYGSEDYQYDAIGNLLKKGNLTFAMDPTHDQRMVCGIDLAVRQGAANGIGNNPHFADCLDDMSGRDKALVGELKAKGVLNNPNIGQSFTVAYDALGNMTQKNGETFIYDGESKLVEVDAPNGKAMEENIYDYRGQRVVTRGPNGQQTTFFDGLYEVTHQMITRHVRVGSQIIASITLPKSHAHLIDSLPVDPLTACTSAALLSGHAGSCGCGAEPVLFWPLVLLVAVRLARSRRLSRVLFQGEAEVKDSALALRARPGRWLVSLLLVTAIAQWGWPADALALPGHDPATKRFYYHPDQVGSTNVITNDLGAEVERMEYKPYGEQYVSSGAQAGPRDLEISFDGQRFDDRTGLYYFGARHYDPVMGRFITADTTPADPDNPQGLQRYGFGYNNPIRYADPNGHDGWAIFFGVLLVIAAIVAVVLTVVFPPAGLGLGAALLFAAGVGAAVGAVLGLGIGLILYGAGVITLGQVGLLVAFGAIVGALIGAAAVGAAAGAAAGASLAAKFAADVLVGAAVGALAGGVQSIIKYGVTDNLLVGTLIGAGIGAVVGLASWLGGAAISAGLAQSWAAALSPIAQAFGVASAGAGGAISWGFVVGLGLVSGTTVLLSTDLGRDLCRATKVCSPGDTAGGAAAPLAASEPGGPVGQFIDDAPSVPAYTFTGTSAERVLMLDGVRHNRPRFPLSSMPAAP
ncbi:MAG TPA: RHS repeat-associated core domain-containing protein, partial [Myxococcaceae bacterium]|nr:RHS repeat-associated core domain-containing protein [Myxococcaceae bacterium]